MGLHLELLVGGATIGVALIVYFCIARLRKPARSNGIEPSFNPTGDLRLWFLTGLAFIAILAVSEGGAYWLIAEDQKPMVETGLPEPITPPAAKAPIDPSPRLVVGLPPIVAPPAMPIRPKPPPQQTSSQMPGATAHPQPADPAKELPSSVRF